MTSTKISVHEAQRRAQRLIDHIDAVRLDKEHAAVRKQQSDREAWRKWLPFLPPLDYRTARAYAIAANPYPQRFGERPRSLAVDVLNVCKYSHSPVMLIRSEHGEILSDEYLAKLTQPKRPPSRATPSARTPPKTEWRGGDDTHSEPLGGRRPRI